MDVNVSNPRNGLATALIAIIVRPNRLVATSVLASNFRVARRDPGTSASGTSPGWRLYAHVDGFRKADSLPITHFHGIGAVKTVERSLNL